MKIKKYIKDKILNYLPKRGRRITRIPMMDYIRQFEVDCMLDVGANTGQFATEARRLGYQGRIESFEPIPSVFETLQQAAANDSAWNTHSYAMGAENCTREINISGNLVSSSFLPVSPDFNPESTGVQAVDSAMVEIRKLDDVFESLHQGARNVYLKIDTQGFEKDVIEGAVGSLPKIQFVQMELSLIANYDGESLIEKMMHEMRELRFDPWWIMDGYRDPKTLQLYQADVFFKRRD